MLPVAAGACAWVVLTVIGFPHAGAVAGIVAAAGLVAGVFVVSDDPRIAPDPEQPLVTSRTTAMINLAITAVAGVVGSWLLGLFGVGTFAVAMPLVLLSTAWGRWLLIVRFWLPLRGRLPRDLQGFLDDACDRGVLRRSGAFYRFRHARLQEHLARPPSGDAPSGDAPSDDAFDAVLADIARTTEGSTRPVTLTVLARDLGRDATVVRSILEGLAVLGMVQVRRDRDAPDGRGAKPRSGNVTDHTSTGDGTRDEIQRIPNDAPEAGLLSAVWLVDGLGLVPPSQLAVRAVACGNGADLRDFVEGRYNRARLLSCRVMLPVLASPRRPCPQLQCDALQTVLEWCARREIMWTEESEEHI